MKVSVGERITVSNPTEAVRKWCLERLVLENPDFYRKQKMGKWTGNTPRQLFLYSNDGDDICIPFGCFAEFHTLFGQECHYKALFCDLREVKYGSSINLYDYQETAVKSVLRRKNGILVMPCGSGKTMCGLEAVARIGSKALWLTHTKDLLNQSMARAKSMYGSGVEYGVVTAGRVKISNAITFATVQTMSKLDLQKYRDCWDIVVVDECQHCCGTPTRVTQFYKVVSNLSARYKIGLTATPKRADGLERAMFALLGDVIYEVSKEDVAHTTCPVRVAMYDTGYVPDYNAVLLGDGTINYAMLVDDMIHNEERFEFVLSKVLECDGPTIVLASRVEYLKRMQEEYDKRHGGFEPSVCLSALGNSKSAKKLRKNTLTALNEGEIDCVFATYQLAKEGLDVPNLRYVVFATPEKDETTVIQSVGRVGRKADGKEFGTVIDFVDDFGMYRGWAKKRMNYYKKIDAEVI